MALRTERSLWLDQHPGVLTFVRQVAGRTLPLTGRGMINPLPLGLFGMTIEAQLVAWFSQQRRLSNGWQVWTMTGETVTGSGWCVDIARLLQLRLIAEELEIVAFKTEGLRVLLGDPGKITGMGIMTDKTVAVGNRGMELRPLKRLLLLGMTAETEAHRLISDSKRLRCTRVAMTALTIAAGHRLVGKSLKQLGIFRRMNAVTGGTTAGHRVVTMCGKKGVAGVCMAFLAELPLLLDQESASGRPVGLVAGVAPLGHRRVDVFFLEACLIVAIETELLERLV